MMCRFSAETTESELCRVFSAYGNVKSTKIIVDRAGVSKGYGFVTFDTPAVIDSLMVREIVIWEVDEEMPDLNFLQFLGTLRNFARSEAQHRTSHQEADILCTQRNYLLCCCSSSRTHQQHSHRAVSSSTLFARWALLMQFVICVGKGRKRR